MTAAPITSEQAKQYRRFVEDASDRALKESVLDKDGLQTLIERGGEFQSYLIEGVRRFSIRGPVFPVYIEIEVGGRSKDKLLTGLKAAGMFVSKWGEDTMSQPAWKAGKRERVKFARVKVRDLGFCLKPTTGELWVRIRELGHSLCESGDGPAIRLALESQPNDDYFWCVMEPINDSVGGPRVFSVLQHGGEPALHAAWARPDHEWNLDDSVVFRLRK